MADLDATFDAFAAARGLEPVPALGLGALTPLLVESKHCQVEPAARGPLGDGVDGIVGRSPVTRREVMPVFTANRMDAGLVLPAYANPKDPADFVLVW